MEIINERTFGNLQSKICLNIYIYMNPLKFSSDIITNEKIFEIISNLSFENIIHGKNLSENEKLKIIQNLGVEYNISNPKIILKDVHENFKNLIETKLQNISLDGITKGILSYDEKILINKLKKIIEELIESKNVPNHIKNDLKNDFEELSELFPTDIEKLYVNEKIDSNEVIKIFQDLHEKMLRNLIISELNQIVSMLNEIWLHIDSFNTISDNTMNLFNEIMKNSLWRKDLDLLYSYLNYRKILKSYTIDNTMFNDYFQTTTITNTCKLNVKLLENMDRTYYKQGICKLLNETYTSLEFDTSDIKVVVYLNINNNDRGKYLGMILCDEEIRRNFFISREKILQRSQIIEKMLYISTVCANPQLDKMYVGIGARLIEFIKKLSELFMYSGVTLESVNVCKTDVENRINCPEFIQDYYLKRGFEFDDQRSIMNYLFYYKIHTRNKNYMDYVKIIASELTDRKTFKDLIYEKNNITKKWERKNYVDRKNIQEILNEKLSLNQNEIVNTNVDTFDEIDPKKNMGNYNLIPMVYYNNTKNLNGISNFGKFRKDYKKLHNNKHINSKKILFKYYNALHHVLNR